MRNKGISKTTIIILTVLLLVVFDLYVKKTRSEQESQYGGLAYGQVYELTDIETLTQQPEQYIGKCVQVAGNVKAVVGSDSFITLPDSRDAQNTIWVRGYLPEHESVIVYGQGIKDRISGELYIKLHKVSC